MKLFPVILLLQIFGLLLFFKGFFPYKNKFSTSMSNKTTIHIPVLKKIVFIVIDALRVDMVYSMKSSKMPNLQLLIQNGMVDCNIAHLQAPTVTMPRIKALTTGSIPGFIDIVFNLNSQELLQDNWISGLMKSGWRIGFAGDDTWLKLFPNSFIVSHPTTSFFVSDFYEVDNNVTRELPNLFASSSISNNNTFSEGIYSWDILILHYLGLDHIGHVEGPKSDKVLPKLSEMDDVIGMIASKFNQWNNHSWSIIVCGDHGMSDYGGHGGASLSETTTPLLTIRPAELRVHEYKDSVSSSCSKDPPPSVEQIDVATSLALLTGLNIPQESRGVFIPSLLHLMGSPTKRIDALLDNIKHFKSIEKLTLDEISELDLVMRRVEQFTALCSNVSVSPSLECQAKLSTNEVEIVQWLRKVQSRTAQTITAYNMPILLLGVTLLWMVFHLLIITIVSKFDIIDWLKQRSIFFHSFVAVVLFLVMSSVIFYQTGSFIDTKDLAPSYFVWFFVYLVATYSIILIAAAIVPFARHHLFFNKIKEMSYCPHIFLLCGVLLHTVSMASSSFVEEEHQTWYFLTTSWHLLLLVFVIPETANTLKRDTKSTLSTGDITVLSRKSPIYFSWRSTGTTLIVIAILDRCLRSLNQTGDKWSHLPDVSDWITKSDNMPILQLSVIVSYVVIGLMDRSYSFMICLFLQLGYRNSSLFFVSNIYVAQICYLSIVVRWCLLMTRFRSSCNFFSICQSSFFLLIILLSRPSNMLLWSCTLLKERLVFHYANHLNFLRDGWKNPLRNKSSFAALVTLYQWYGLVTFYHQGNSHSLATVDVSAGYVGLHDYQPIFTACLLAISTFAGPLFWTLSFLARYSTICDTSVCSHLSPEMDDNDTKSGTLNNYDFWSLIYLSLFSLPVAFFCSICSALRYHIFVWTVFSPKLLYLSGHLITSMIPFLFVIILTF